MWGPPVISWFINPHNYSYLRTINHSYWSYVHQLSYRTGAPHSSFPGNFSPAEFPALYARRPGREVPGVELATLHRGDLLDLDGLRRRGAKGQPPVPKRCRCFHREERDMEPRNLWENMGKYWKILENMGKYGKIMGKYWDFLGFLLIYVDL